MSDLWPSLDSLSITLPIHLTMDLSPAHVGILHRLVSYIGGLSVHTYTSPVADPYLPDDDKRLKAMTGASRHEWASFKQYMPRFFALSEGRWRLINGDFIRLSRPNTRAAISTAVKSIVLARDGQRCAYCGTIEGPFHIDHIYPVSRGGSDLASNLVLACAQCNLSKGGLTLAEWVGR